MNRVNENKSGIELLLYDFEKSFAENFSDDTDKHVLIRISKTDNIIQVQPDIFSVCVSKPKYLMDSGIDKLKFLNWDYDTIFGTRYNIFKKYACNFFDCQERVFFEALLINYKMNDFKSFKWEQTKISRELGIKRTKLETIINRFKDLGIIVYTQTKMGKVKNGKPRLSTHFKVDERRVLELLPKIFSDFDFDKVSHDLHRYMKPAFN